MPNYVTTKLTITGPREEVSRFRQEILNSEELPVHFDFNKVIPMPEEVEGTESSSYSWEGLWAHRGVDSSFGSKKPTVVPWVDHWAQGKLPPEGVTNLPEYLVWLKHHKPSIYNAGLRAAQCYDKTGYADWYGWCISNWGTKWNSSDTEVLFHDVPGGFLLMRFVTAWSFPHPVFTELVKMFPTLTFVTTTFDEGWMFASKGVFNSTVTLYDEFEPHKDKKRGVLLHQEVYDKLPDEAEDFREDTNG